MPWRDFLPFKNGNVALTAGNKKMNLFFLTRRTGVLKTVFILNNLVQVFFQLHCPKNFLKFPTPVWFSKDWHCSENINFNWLLTIIQDSSVSQGLLPWTQGPINDINLGTLFWQSSSLPVICATTHIIILTKETSPHRHQ